MVARCTMNMHRKICRINHLKSRPNTVCVSVQLSPCATLEMPHNVAVAAFSSATAEAGFHFHTVVRICTGFLTKRSQNSLTVIFSLPLTHLYSKTAIGRKRSPFPYVLMLLTHLCRSSHLLTWPSLKFLISNFPLNQTFWKVQVSCTKKLRKF